MTFQEIIANQINSVMEYYGHIGNYFVANDILEYGNIKISSFHVELM